MSELLLLYGAFALISLSGALSPGPLTALAISEGARAGRWSGAAIAVGHGLVEGPAVFAIAYGLGTWLRQPLVSGLIGLTGAAVLLWIGYGLAVGAWRGQLTLSASSGAPAPSVLRFGHAPAGVIFTLSNPYWALWWATLGAAYIARVVTLQPGPLALLGFVFIHWLTDLVWLGGLSLLVGSGRGLIGDRGYRVILLICAAFLLAFGVYFAGSGLAFLMRARPAG